MIVSKNPYVNPNYWSKNEYNGNGNGNFNANALKKNEEEKTETTFIKHKRYFNDNNTQPLSNNCKKQKTEK